MPASPADPSASPATPTPAPLPAARPPTRPARRAPGVRCDAVLPVGPSPHHAMRRRMQAPGFPVVSPRMSLDPALRSRIESLLQDNRVVLFMKGQPGMPQCGFSGKAIGVLEDLGVGYALVNVLADQELRVGIKACGNWPTIPQLYIGAALVGGSDIIEQRAASGELSQI